MDPSFSTQLFSFGIMKFRAQIPSWNCSQKQLLSLAISNTGIIDAFPPWSWNFSSQFTYLNISHNQIYGEIPHIPLIFSPSSIIDMNSNHFECPLPCLSSNLSFLDLSNNSLSGSIFTFCVKRWRSPKIWNFSILEKIFYQGNIISSNNLLLNSYFENLIIGWYVLYVLSMRLDS